VISPWKSRDAIPVKRAFYSFCLRRDVAGGDCCPNSGQKKEHLTFIGWVAALGLIPMDKIAQRSQANGVLGLCIAQCDLLGVSTAGKKLTRRRLPAGLWTSAVLFAADRPSMAMKAVERFPTTNE
jgi:hypothetical protein